MPITPIPHSKKCYTYDMKIFVWILQILLALWEIVGGLYMAANHQLLASIWAAQFFPSYFWILLGAVQVILALGLVSSVIKGISKKVVATSAILLALISLVGIVLYAKYAGFPGVLWGIIPALLLLFVAYERAK